MAHHWGRRVAVAAVGIPAAIGVIYAGGWVLAAALGGLGAAGSWEWYRLAQRRGLAPLVPAGVAGAALLAPGAWLVLPRGVGLEPRWFALGLAGWVMLIMAGAMARRRPDQGPMGGIAVTVVGALYAGGLPAFLFWLRYPDGTSEPWTGTALACLPLAVTWVCDTAAMAGGVLLGGPKLAPVLSPAKTWVGALAGGFGALGSAWLYGRWILHPLGLEVPAGVLLACGLAVAILGQTGDVAESLLKREAGVKDSGSLLPGHGGILDRLDSLYWAIPGVAGVLAASGVV